MEYKFIYHSKVEDTLDPQYHENAFRIGYPGYTSNGADGAGSRYPSMWIYYDPGAGYTPHCKFSLSNSKNPYAQFKILYPIETEQIYFVVIEFNQSWNTITMTNDSSTITLIDAPRAAGTDELFLNTNMSVWISQFGYNSVDGPEITAAANITMWDIRISTSKHHDTLSPTEMPTAFPSGPPTPFPESHPTGFPTADPTVIPTVNPTGFPTPYPSTGFPTESPSEFVPINSTECPQGIELYEFYNESNVALRDQMELYSQWVHDAVISTLENVTGYSMDIQDEHRYQGQQWQFGGVSQWIGCMVFNERITETLIGCPSIPQPKCDDFQFVAVQRMWVEADRNVESFREYIVGQLNSSVFTEKFRVSLKEIVSQQAGEFNLEVGGETAGEERGVAHLYLESIGSVLIVLCCMVCIMTVMCFKRQMDHRDRIGVNEKWIHRPSRHSAVVIQRIEDT